MKKKTKYLVTGGFLGAGKTTTTIAFARIMAEKYGKPRIIANDLGVADIVDGYYTQTTEFYGDEIMGGCICYCTDELVFRINQLIKQGAEIVLSDIPGCCVAALDHIYGSIEKEYPGVLDLAPFVTLVDPERIKLLTDKKDEVGLPDSQTYTLNAQLMEANVIILNKADLLSEDEIAFDVELLKARYPGKPVFVMSAKEGTGVEEVVDYLMSNSATLDVSPDDIGYGSEAFNEAMRDLSWFNRRTILRTRDGSPVDFNEVVDFLIGEIKSGLVAAERNVAHLKFYGEGRGDVDFAKDMRADANPLHVGLQEPGGSDFVKGSMVGVEAPLSYDSKLVGLYPRLSFVLNSRSVCESNTMLKIVDAAYDAAYSRFGLEGQIFFTECWGLRDEGRK